MDLPRRQPSPGHSDDFTSFSPFVHHPFPFSRSDWAFLVSSLDQYALSVSKFALFLELFDGFNVDIVVFCYEFYTLLHPIFKTNQ